LDPSRYRGLFLADSREHLDRTREGLRRLREGHGSLEVVAEILRHAHSLKGLAATMGYDALAASAHELEDLVEPLRDGSTPTEATLDEIQRAVGVVARRLGGGRGPALVPFGSLAVGLFEGVRELAVRQGKRLSLGLEGGEIGVDGRLLDALCEPLLHLLLNAVDHGIEPPSERERCGKPAIGSIRVRLDRGGDRVLLRVEDDGRGVDETAVRRRALEDGWISAEEAASLDRERLLRLLTRPGFSTWSGVGLLSGRGIGLDAVRDAVERLGGELAIDTSPGRGTTVTMSLPAAER